MMGNPSAPNLGFNQPMSGSGQMQGQPVSILLHKALLASSNGSKVRRA